MPAAQYVTSRAAVTRIAMSASRRWFAAEVSRAPPSAARAASNAACATPTERAAMLMRPVSRPDITCLNPRPSTPPTRFAAGTRTLSKTSSAVSTPL